VSTAEQVDSGAGLAVQRATVEAEAARRGWTLLAVFEDAGRSGKSIDGRPALAEALAAVEDGTAAALIVAKLDRLSRSVQDAAGLLDRAGRAGWALVASDLGVDTSTPAGEAMANVMASFGQLERRMIGQRTKDALTAKRAAGVRLGRPSTLPDVVVRRIVDEHAAGESWSAIARGLEADGVPTAQGGVRWYPATVRKVAAGQDAAALAG
jgi:DNA invertase Pin-like site-specific DNA recombinase